MNKVLIVDDAFFVRMKVKRVLEQHDYVVIEAENGVEAVEITKREKPQIILLDLIMPVMDGLTALKNIMAIHPSAKVIMITGYADQALFMEALELGAKDLILKPINEEKILEIVKKFA